MADECRFRGILSILEDVKQARDEFAQRTEEFLHLANEQNRRRLEAAARRVQELHEELDAEQERAYGKQRARLEARPEKGLNPTDLKVGDRIGFNHDLFNGDRVSGLVTASWETGVRVNLENCSASIPLTLEDLAGAELLPLKEGRGRR